MTKRPDVLDVGVIANDEHAAIQAVNDGVASEYQQKLALATIVKKLCRTHDLTYCPGSFDESAFLSGRAYVGHNIIRLTKTPVGKLS